MAAKIASGLAFALVCIAMFEVPSSLVVDRGYSPWLALVVGVAAFPIVPVAWHLAAERRRRGSDIRTSGVIRFVYRTVATSVLALALVLALGRAYVGDALCDHFLWFVPGHTVWFLDDPPPPGSPAACEAFATMEMKCDPADNMDHARMLDLCEFAAIYNRDPKLTRTIEVPERCALATSGCGDYHACISAGGHGW